MAGIGGTYAAMVTSGSIICATFSYRLMTGTLIGKLFHFKGAFASEIISSKSKRKKKKNKNKNK